MKKQLLALGLLLGTSLSAIAQTPEMVNKSVVWKFTETWCGPCGSWGWDLAESILADIGDKGYYVGVMGSSSPSSMNAMGYDAFVGNFPIAGYPTFMVNNTDGGSYISTVRPLYNGRASAEVEASSAAYMDMVEGNIYVKVNSKFWAAATGDYYIGAYVIEDKVMAGQNGQSGTVAHHYLMRGTMNSDLSPWGQSIANGAIDEGTQFTHNFTTTLKSGWKAADISVLLVIYKKVSGKYQIVNSIKATPSPASIKNLAEMNNVTLYPNPNNGSSSNLELNLNETATLAVRVTDISGRIVYNMDAKQYNAGKTIVSIPVDKLANGVYNVTVYNNKNGHMNTSMVISK